MQQRFTQTNLESQTKQSNVNMLTEAIAPLDASASPRILAEHACWRRWAACLLAAGHGAGTWRLRDRRVRNVDDVLVGFPRTASASVTLTTPWIAFGPTWQARQSLMQQRLLAPLPQLQQGCVMAKFQRLHTRPQRSGCARAIYRHQLPPQHRLNAPDSDSASA